VGGGAPPFASPHHRATTHRRSPAAPDLLYTLEIFAGSNPPTTRTLTRHRAPPSSCSSSYSLSSLSSPSPDPQPPAPPSLLIPSPLFAGRSQRWRRRSIAARRKSSSSRRRRRRPFQSFSLAKDLYASGGHTRPSEQRDLDAGVTSLR
jgi:hypothetical protein